MNNLMNKDRAFPAWIAEPIEDGGRLVINYYPSFDGELSSMIGTVHGIALYATIEAASHNEFPYFWDFVSEMDREMELLENDFKLYQNK